GGYMATTAKKRPGRPRKSPFEKQLQFSISLTPMTKLALEIMARDRGESLSQAVDFAITSAASTYEVEGQKLMKNLRERMNHGLQALGVDPDKVPIEKVITVQNALLRSEAGRVFMVPSSLWTPEERYFVDVFDALKDSRLPVNELDDLL